MMTREEAVERLKRLKRSCRDLAASMPEEPGWALHGMALDMAISALRSVSQEQVILCKDCMYWQGNNGGYPHPECRWGHDETPDEDDYCSFAERLEVNKND